MEASPAPDVRRPVGDARLAWRLPTLVGLGVVLALALAVWPVLILAGAVVGVVIVLAWRAPEYAFVVTIVLFASEGSLKALLGYEGVPFSTSADALGAVLLDTCLVVSALGLLRRDARIRLGQVWRGLPRSVQVGFGLLAVWIAISAVQVLAIGSVTQGVQGFRLVQGYVVLGIVGALLLERLPRTVLVPLLLGGFLLISGYSVLRMATGPGAVERAHNIQRAGVETFGGVVRAAGSFSAAVGLASYLAPAAAFAFVIALAIPRYRLLAAAVFGLAIAGIIGSYVRSGVVALDLGILVGGGLVVAQSHWTNARRLSLVTALAVTIVAVGVATAMASRASSDLEERAQAYVDHTGDESVQLRFETWKDTLAEVRRHPFGTGVGSVGRASAGSDAGSTSTSGTGNTVITDNSYLKIVREQGWLVGPVFVAALAVLLVSLGLALLRRPGPFRPLGAAALAGSVAFLALGLAGEYIEQPGKTLAWFFLGLAAIEVSDVRPPEPPTPGRSVRDWLSRWLGAAPVAMLARWAAFACLVVAMPVALTLAREPRFVTTIELTPRTAESSPAALAASVSRLVEDRSISYATTVDADVSVDPAHLAERVRVVPSPDAVRVEVWGKTSGQADRLAAALVRTFRRAENPGIVVVPAPGPDRLVDRAADALPGVFPTRPDPFWAGFAALALCVLAVVAFGLAGYRSPTRDTIRVS